MSNSVTSFDDLADRLRGVRDEAVVSINDEALVCRVVDADVWQILVEANSALPAPHGSEVLFRASSLWETYEGGMLEGGWLDATLTSSDSFIVVEATITVQGWSPWANESPATEQYRYVLLALTAPTRGVQAHLFGTLDALLVRAVRDEEGIVLRAFISERSEEVVHAKLDEHLEHDITSDGVAIPRVDGSMRGAMSSLGRLLSVWSSRT